MQTIKNAWQVFSTIIDESKDKDDIGMLAQRLKLTNVKHVWLADGSGLDVDSGKIVKDEDEKNQTTRLLKSTVIQDTLKIGQKYSTAPQAQERVSERANERARERSEQCGARERVSGASEQASG